MKVGNSTNSPDVSDMKNPTGPSGSKSHKGGRRVSVGTSVNAGGPGMKEKHLREARTSNQAHTKAFRSGSQDARSGATSPGNGPTGAVSPSAVQVKTRRRGNGPAMRTPRPRGGE